MNIMAGENTEAITQPELLPVQNEVPFCFACGLENHAGLKLRFTKLNDTSLRTEFTPPEHWTGWGRMMHGGFHGLLLDEIMSWIAFGLMNCKTFVTKRMTVEYIRPIHVGQPLRIFGYLEEDTGKEIHTRGEIRDIEGNILSTSHGLLVRVDADKMKGMSLS